jgi:hypothetical protein
MGGEMTSEKRIKVDYILDLMQQNEVCLKDLVKRISEMPFHYGTPQMERILAALEEPVEKNNWRIF